MPEKRELLKLRRNFGRIFSRTEADSNFFTENIRNFNGSIELSRFRK